MSEVRQKGSPRFSLVKMLQLVAAASIVASLFAAFPLMIALLGLCVINALAACYFWFANWRSLCLISCTTSALIFATVFFTDWGVSRPNGQISVAWPFLIVACIAQVDAMAMWLLNNLDT